MVMKMNHTRRHKRFHKKKPTVQSLSKAVKRVEKDVDLKWDDIAYGVTLSAGQFTYCGVTNGNTPITGILPQGVVGGSAVENSRAGENVRVTSLNWRMNAVSLANDVNNVVLRVLIIKDRSPKFNSASGVPSLIFTPPTTAAGVTPDTFWSQTTAGNLAFPQVQNYSPYTCQGSTSRFKILFDKTVIIRPTTSTATNAAGTADYVFNIRAKKSFGVVYSNPAGGNLVTTSYNTNLIKNDIYLCVAADSPCVITSVCRTWYKDA